MGQTETDLTLLQYYTPSHSFLSLLTLSTTMEGEPPPIHCPPLRWHASGLAPCDWARHVFRQKQPTQSLPCGRPPPPPALLLVMVSVKLPRWELWYPRTSTKMRPLSDAVYSSCEPRLPP